MKKKGSFFFKKKAIHFYFTSVLRIQIFLYDSALVCKWVLILKFYTVINEHQRYKGVWLQ